MPLDALPVLSILDRITDADGDIVSLGSIEFYEAGTITPRTVYSDSGLSVSLGTIVYGDTGGYPVSTQGGSTKVSIYTGTGAFKVIVKDSSGTALITRDNIPGALDTSSFAPQSATPETPVSSKTAAYTIVTADHGKLFNANPTGGSFVMTLPSAVTVGDGWRVGIRHAGTANTVTISAVLSQSIAQPGPATSHITLTGRGETFWLVSDGAGWTIESPHALARTNRSDFIVTDRLTAPPTSPTAGAYYIITGTPTGTWSSYAEHDLLEADGNGGWIRRTPAAGWRAHVLDEAIDYVFHTSTWNAQSNVEAPTTSTLKQALFLDQRADGTAGGSATAAAWTTATLGTQSTNTITGCSLSSNAITLPAGTYYVQFAKFMSAGNTQGIRLKIANGGTPIYYRGINNPLSGAEKVTLSGAAGFTLAASDTITLEYYAQSNTDTGDLGEALNIATGGGNTEYETYAYVNILELTAQQGPQGEQGTQGSDGLDAAYPYRWSTSTSGDPGTGKIAGNNATIASITQLAVSETDSAGGSMGAVIATWDDSTSSDRALVKISKEGATENFHAFRITGAGTDQGSYWTFPVTYLATTGTIANGTDCAVLVIEKGDKGDTGSTGSAATASFDYTFSTSIGAAPATGTVRANNANLSLATALYVHDTDRLGVAQDAAVAQWDDSTTTAHRGYVTLASITTPANKARFEITGASTDSGTFHTIAVTYVSGVTSLSSGNVQIIWERTGDKGAPGGMTQEDKAASFSLSTGDNLKHFSLVTTAGTVTVPAASGFDEMFNFKVTNSSSRGWVIAPDGVTSFTLYPTQTIWITQINNAWVVENSFRWQTRTAITFYVNHASGSNSNDGLTSGSAFATIQKAIDVIEANIDCLVNGPTIQVANGTFTENNVVHTKRLMGNHVIYIAGDGATPSNCVWQCAAGQTCFTARDWSGVILNGFRFKQASGSGATLISASQHGIVDVWNIDFGDCAGGIHVSAVNGGSVGYVTGASVAISGTSYAYHWYIASESCLICAGTSSYAVSAATFTAFCSNQGGSLTLAGVTFSGAGAGSGSTGTKFIVVQPSTMILGGVTMPGATAGVGYWLPSSNAADALGQAGQGFSRLYLSATAQIDFNSGDVTIEHGTNQLSFRGASVAYYFDAMVASATDGASNLGSGTKKWGNAFLKAGGTINFNNGNVVLTHNNALTELQVTTGSLSVPSGRIAVGMTGPSIDLTVHSTANEIGRLLTSQSLGYFQIFNTNGTNSILVGGNNAVGFFQNTSGTELEMQVSGATATAKVRAGELSAQSDHGGKAGYISLSGTSDLAARSTGVGTIKFDDATNRDSAGFIKFYIGTTAYYVPVFAAI
jgi:hypothetical protein